MSNNLTPQRQTVDVTTGVGIVAPIPSAQALAPTIGVGNGGINPLAICGVDTQSATVTTTTSTSHLNEFSATVSLPLPRLPAPFTPNSNDSLFMLVQGFISNTGGFEVVCLESQQLQIIGTTANGGRVYGPKLQTGVTYIGWSIVANLLLYCPQGAAPSGMSYTVNALLLDTPG